MSLTREQIDPALIELGVDPAMFWEYEREYTAHSGRHDNVLDTCRSVSNLIGAAFSWDRTPQGTTYWNNLQQRAIKLESNGWKPAELKSRCKCYWSRHPLFCRCPND